MISVIFPVYNEQDILADSVEKVHRYLQERDLDHEILVTSNGSTDRTVEIGRELATRYPWFRFFELPAKSVGKAFVKNVEEAKGDFLVSLDIDLSFDLRFIDYANHLLRYGEMVIGSKTMGKQRRSALRVLASQAYILVSQLAFDLTVSDYSIGCKAFQRKAILDALPYLDNWTGYIFELCLFLEARDKRIIQIGVDCDDRRASHFNLVHEGFYRYNHLYKMWKKLRNPDSWINKLKTSKQF